MNREDILRMAREQGCPETATDGVFLVNSDDLGRLLAADRERIIAANAPEIERCNAHIKALEDELKALREFAAGRCTIQKVIDELGPMSLWSKDGLEREISKAVAAERKAMMQLFTDPENQPTQHGTVTVEYMQREIAAEREACAYRAGIALLGADRGLASRIDQAIRARGQA